MAEKTTDQLIREAFPGMEFIPGTQNTPGTLTVKKDPIKETTGQNLLEALGFIGKTIDRVTGAPTRSAIQKGIETGSLPASIKEFITKFGRDPSQAPTGKGIASQLGLPEKPLKDIDPQSGGILTKASPAGIAGFILDVAADPSVAIPGGTIVKAIKKGVSKTGAPLAKTAAKTVDIATGTKGATTLVESVGEFGKTSKEGLRAIFSPQPQKSFPESVKIAQKAGIAKEDLPKAVEFGKSSVLSRAERAKAEGPTGEALLKTFQDNQDKLRESISGEITKIAEPLDKVSAGELARNKFDEGLEKFFDNMDITNQEVISEVPGLVLSDKAIINLEKKLDGLEKYAKGEISRGITKSDRAKGDQLLRAVQAIRASNYSYKQAYEALKRIGRTAFQSKNSLADVPPDIGRLRKLYGDLNEALHTTIKDDVVGGPEIVKELKANNEAISLMYGDKSALANIMGNKNLAPEKLFTAITGDTRKIKALKTFLGPEEMNSLKASFLESLIKRGPEGEFSFKALHNSLRTKKPIIDELFNKTEISQINDFIKLADRMGESVLSMSGTGASNAFLRFFKETLGKAGEAAIAAPVERAARTPVMQPAPYFPLIKTPKQYFKGPGSRAKATQLLSVQQENEKREAMKRALNQ